MGKEEGRDLSVKPVSSKICSPLWPWPWPEGCSGPIYLSWPKWISLELIPFTGKPFTVFLPKVSYNFGFMLSQVCGVLVSLTSRLLTVKTSCLTVSTLSNLHDFPTSFLPWRPTSVRNITYSVTQMNLSPTQYSLFRDFFLMNFRSRSLHLIAQWWNKQNITPRCYLGSIRIAVLFNKFAHEVTPPPPNWLLVSRTRDAAKIKTI